MQGIVVLTDDQFQSFVQGRQVVFRPDQQVVYLGQGPGSANRQPAQLPPPLSANVPPGEFAPPPGGFAPPPGGFAPPPGGFAPPPGGFAPPPGGFAPPPGGFAPPPGEFAPPPGGFALPPGRYIPPLIDNRNNGPPSDPYLAFFVTFPAAMGTYIFFLLACIIIQYVVCGALQAGQLWISCLVFVLVASSLIRATKHFNQVYFLFGGMFFFFLQEILEIAAFAIAVSHPPILILQTNTYYGDYEYTYTQDAGSCLLYSDASGLPSEYLKYNNGLQFGCLAVHCIQFLLSFLVCYQFGKRSWVWQRELRLVVPHPPIQPIPVPVA